MFINFVFENTKLYDNCNAFHTIHQLFLGVKINPFKCYFQRIRNSGCIL